MNDSFEVRQKAAWYVVGVDRMAGLSFIFTLIAAAMGGLVSGVFELDAPSAVVGVSAAISIGNVALAGWLHIGAKSAAKHLVVPIDQI